MKNSDAPTFGLRKVGVYEKFDYVDTFEDLKILIDESGLTEFVVKIKHKRRRLDVVMSHVPYFAAAVLNRRHPSLSGLKRSLE